MLRADCEQFIEDIPVEWVRGRRGPAGPTWTDLRVLLGLLTTCRPVRCLEVGIHEGHTAQLLLEHGANIEHYVGIDRTYTEQTRSSPPTAGHLVADDPRVDLLVVEGGTRLLRPKDVPWKPFDWVFIDSDHCYGGVKHDTEWVQPLLAERSILIWHDYGVPSQYKPGTRPFGVMRYLDEWTGDPPVVSFIDPPHSSSIAFQRFLPPEPDPGRAA